MTEFNDLDFVYEQIEGDAKDVGSILQELVNTDTEHVTVSV